MCGCVCGSVCVCVWPPPPPPSPPPLLAPLPLLERKTETESERERERERKEKICNTHTQHTTHKHTNIPSRRPLYCIFIHPLPFLLKCRIKPTGRLSQFCYHGTAHVSACLLQQRRFTSCWWCFALLLHRRSCAKIRAGGSSSRVYTHYSTTGICQRHCRKPWRFTTCGGALCLYAQRMVGLVYRTSIVSDRHG